VTGDSQYPSRIGKDMYVGATNSSNSWYASRRLSPSASRKNLGPDGLQHLAKIPKVPGKCAILSLGDGMCTNPNQSMRYYFKNKHSNPENSTTDAQTYKHIALQTHVTCSFLNWWWRRRILRTLSTLNEPNNSNLHRCDRCEPEFTM
jgi:hypothetical protein